MTSITEKAKTRKELTNIHFSNFLTRKSFNEELAKQWIPLEEAQKLETENQMMNRDNIAFEKDNIKLTDEVSYFKQELSEANDIAMQYKNKINKALKILRGHCSGFYHCQKNCYDELKEELE